MTSTQQTFVWSNSGATQFWLWVGTSAGGQNLYSADQGANLSVTVSGLPFEGETLYVRLWSLINGEWIYNDYTYTAYDYTFSKTMITSPIPGSIFDSRTMTFNWSDSGADQYWLQVGLSLGGDEIYSADQGTGTTATLSNLPHNGETLYVRCSTLTSTTITFTWNDVGQAQYWLVIGTTLGGDDIYTSDQGTNTSAEVSNLPSDGEPLYVRLWSLMDGNWCYNDHIYTTFSN